MVKAIVWGTLQRATEQVASPVSNCHGVWACLWTCTLRTTKTERGWGCSSAAEHLPSMFKALALPTQTKTTKCRLHRGDEREVEVQDQAGQMTINQSINQKSKSRLCGLCRPLRPCRASGLPGFNAGVGTGSTAMEKVSPNPCETLRVRALSQYTSVVSVVSTHEENLSDFLLLCLQIFWL